MKKLLALNRGEIAIRIMRAATELGLRTVAIYSAGGRAQPAPLQGRRGLPDRRGQGPGRGLSRHRRHRRAGEGEGRRRDPSRLRISLGEPGVCRAPASRPASHSSGPSAELLELLGDKTAARRLAAKAGVPIVPGVEHAGDDAGDVAQGRRARSASRSSSRPRSAAAAAACASCERRTTWSSRLDEAQREARVGVRQRRRVPRALHPAAAAHRSADSRRPATAT